MCIGDDLVFLIEFCIGFNIEGIHVASQYMGCVRRDAHPTSSKGVQGNTTSVYVDMKDEIETKIILLATLISPLPKPHR